MNTKLGILGEPRIGIALIWFLPANPDETRTSAEQASPEEVEFIRDLTGLGPMELLTRLRGIAAAYAHDPAALRAEIVRLTDGNEIAAEHIIQLIRAAAAPDADNDADNDEDNDGGDADDGGESGQVIDFERSDERNEDEDDEPHR